MFTAAFCQRLLTYNFCNKIFRGFRPTGVKISGLPVDLLVIQVTTEQCLSYYAVCDEQ